MAHIKTAREQLEKLRIAQTWSVPEVMAEWNALSGDEKMEYLFRVGVELDIRLVDMARAYKHLKKRLDIVEHNVQAPYRPKGH